MAVKGRPSPVQVAGSPSRSLSSASLSRPSPLAIPGKQLAAANSQSSFGHSSFVAAAFSGSASSESSVASRAFGGGRGGAGKVQEIDVGVEEALFRNCGISQIVLVGDTSKARLKKIDLRDNPLCRDPLPHELGNVKSMRVLWLSRTGLRVVPDAIAGMTTLTELVLNDNHLTELPWSLGCLSNLKSLQLYNNKLSGEVPEWVSECKQLRKLNLDNNVFSTIHPSIAGLKKLDQLSMFGNHLSPAKKGARRGGSQSPMTPVTSPGGTVSMSVATSSPRKTVSERHNSHTAALMESMVAQNGIAGGSTSPLPYSRASPGGTGNASSGDRDRGYRGGRRPQSASETGATQLMLTPPLRGNRAGHTVEDREKEERMMASKLKKNIGPNLQCTSGVREGKVWEQFSDKEARAIKDDPKFWKVKHNSLNTNVMNRHRSSKYLFSDRTLQTRAVQCLSDLDEIGLRSGSRLVPRQPKGAIASASNVGWDSSSSPDRTFIDTSAAILGGESPGRSSARKAGASASASRAESALSSSRQSGLGSVGAEGGGDRRGSVKNWGAKGAFKANALLDESMEEYPRDPESPTRSEDEEESAEQHSGPRAAMRRGGVRASFCSQTAITTAARDDFVSHSNLMGLDSQSLSSPHGSPSQSPHAALANSLYTANGRGGAYGFADENNVEEWVLYASSMFNEKHPHAFAKDGSLLWGKDKDGPVWGEKAGERHKRIRMADRQHKLDMSPETKQRLFVRDHYSSVTGAKRTGRPNVDDDDSWTVDGEEDEEYRENLLSQPSLNMVEKTKEALRCDRHCKTMMEGMESKSAEEILQIKSDPSLEKLLDYYRQLEADCAHLTKKLLSMNKFVEAELCQGLLFSAKNREGAAVMKRFLSFVSAVYRLKGDFEQQAKVVDSIIHAKAESKTVFSKSDSEKEVIVEEHQGRMQVRFRGKSKVFHQVKWIGKPCPVARGLSLVLVEERVGGKVTLSNDYKFENPSTQKAITNDHFDPSENVLTF